MAGSSWERGLRMGRISGKGLRATIRSEMHDPIIEELHRNREDLLREHGNDPEALVRYLQEKERSSGRRGPAAAEPQPSSDQRARFARPCAIGQTRIPKPVWLICLAL